MKHLRSALTAAAISLLIPASIALAAGVFPDVGDSHPFKGEIESLFRLGVVKGNPSGLFVPDRDINRAEFLKLLYTTMKKQPKTVSAKCFSDVEAGSWYESIVCDAAAKENGYVQGYGDGTFRPGNSVSRTEALKMTFTVMGLNVADISATDKEVIKFVDISVSAWYSAYVSAGYKKGILPIYGFGGARFYPDKPLTRGEASAYIFNALKVKDTVAAAQSSSASKKAEETYVINDVAFPFNYTDQFEKKKPIAYNFSLNAKTTVAITVGASGNTASNITCRLYLFEANDFSSEYYLGVQSENSCKILANVPPGKYQLQVQPEISGIPYFVNATNGSTDGNDGFMDAVSLTLGVDQAGTFDSSTDLFDWYTFKVDAARKGTLFFTSTEDLKCIIYTPSTVDQFGFTGPECGLQYSYQSGLYTVGIGRKAGVDLSKKLEYSVKWR